MKWASALSRLPAAADALGEAAGAVEERLGGMPPDLLVAFVSSDHAEATERIAALAARRFPGALLVGCTAGGVIGDAREAEEGPALSLTAASLPGVELSGFRADAAARAGATGWRDRVGRSPETDPKLLLLADPFSIDARALIEGLDAAYPGQPKFGGLASGGAGPGENRLFLGRDVFRGGAVGVALSGDVRVDTLIAQGCRPIGEPMRITRCRDSLLLELDGRPPLHVLADLYAALGERDRELMRHSLFLGLEMRAEALEHASGELLVRNLLGGDESSGALAVGAELRPMTVARFVLRDAHSAEEELRSLLDRRRRAGAAQPAGALLFSCLGRGEGLFGHPDHDTSLFEERLGPSPLGGFFCNGEIGPVGGTTFLHGYTSAFAMFREARGGGADRSAAGRQ